VLEITPLLCCDCFASVNASSCLLNVSSILNANGSMQCAIRKVSVVLC
jgi:hypothetical protein